MMRLWLPLACFFCHLFIAQSTCLAEKRVALVIGNSAYKHALELANPRHDAEDIAITLRALGIEVIKGVDLDKSAMDREIRKFSMALSGADVGIFFYAGHGLQVNGNNFLVPVDAELSTAAALEFEMVRLDLIQRIMEAETKTNILFLDACRNNPLSRNLARAMGTRSAAIGRGLAAAESGVGTLISFSTQPGNVALDGDGRNSPYAGPLAKGLAKPGEDVLSILTGVRNEVLAATGDKQVPWENHALRARFYFNPVAASASIQPTPQSDAPGANMSEAERAWSATRDSKDPALLEAFLRRFGDSFYGDLAKSRLDEIKRTKVAAVVSPTGPPELATTDCQTTRAFDVVNRACTDIIGRFPTLAAAYAVRGNTYRTRQNYENAVTDLSKALELDPKDAFARSRRGLTYLNKRDEAAAADLDQVIAITPNRASEFEARGSAYSGKKEYDRAIADFTSAIELDPKYTLAYSNRGNASLNNKDFDRAILDLTRAIELDPKYAVAYSTRGSAYFGKKDYDRAISDHTRAIELDPKYPSAFSNRGSAYGLNKDYDRAIADYTRAIELNPMHADAHNGRGAAYAYKKEFDRAIADYTKAIEIFPKFALAYNNRGLSHDKNKDYDRAIADYTKAMAINPNYAEAYDNRCNSHARKKDYDRAIADCTRAIELNPKSTFSYNNRANSFANKKNNDRAVADYNKVIELDPKNSYAIEGLKLLGRKPKG
jgi:uncharacterized caspase-like protein/tetratricopeptide (TPR) repeat protein